MKKKINEIFYSIQGEGLNAGRAAVFIRFSGCNLRCPFCDTKHEDGEFMTDEEIAEEVAQYPTDLVVITGGEPSLFLDSVLCDRLHDLSKKIAVETNGTHELPPEVNFITLSPKYEYTKGAELAIFNCNELKVVYNGTNNMERYESISAEHKFLQPCDTGNKEENERIINEVVEYCKVHPEWRISLQTQKIINVR